MGKATFLILGVVFSMGARASNADELLGSNPTLEVLASTPKCCVCETDYRIPGEVKFYKAGCSMWLKRQKGCVYSQTIIGNSIYTARPVAFDLPENCRGLPLHWGYVGHGMDLNQKVENHVLPTAQVNQSTVDFDDTSCSGMSQARRTHSVVRTLAARHLKSAQYLSIKGNQAISVGLWDNFLPGAENFYALSDSRAADIYFPTCPEYENKKCNGKYQAGERGICQNGKTEKTLRCQKLREWGTMVNEQGQEVQGLFSSYRWIAQ